MSRHRNIRNLTEDDYYDDYDDYDYDDDYDEEHDETAQQYSYPKASKPSAFAVHTPNADSASTYPPISGQNQKAASSMGEQMRLLEGMGFPSEEAKRALAATDNDSERAVELLVTGGMVEPSPSTRSSIPRPSRSATTPNKPGIARPPPGFKAPPSAVALSQNMSVEAPSETQPTISLASPLANQTEKTPASSSSARAAKSTQDSSGITPPPKQTLPPHIAEALTQQRSRLSMVVLGHVDAGKSTLMGQVLLQLGHVQTRTIAKYEKQAAGVGKASSALAWVMDEDDSERERGVTMEVATKYISIPKHDFVVLDAPGHAEFIPAMISGAASADVGLLVVAASIGEFEAGFNSNEANSVNSKSGGQTREHVVLARGLGVSQLIVAVNKLDAVQWSQHRYQEIQSKLQPFLQANGFAPKRVRFVPMSGLTGINVKQRPTEALLTAWYTGPTLLEAMNDFVPAQRVVDKPLRAIVTDAYAEGKGVTTKCRIVQGVVKAGDKVAVLPIGDSATLARIDHGLVADTSNDRMSWAMAGDTVDLVFAGLDIARISPGCVLSPTHLSLRPPIQRKMQAKILVMNGLAVPIIRGAQVLWHMHSLDVPATVSKMLWIVKRDGTQKDRPRVLTSGANAVVEITLNAKVCLETYMDCRALGRFVLRRGGDTIAVGIIEQILR